MYPIIFKRLALLAVLVGLTSSVPMSNITAAGSWNITAGIKPNITAGIKPNITAGIKPNMTALAVANPPPPIDDEPTWIDFFEFIRNLFTPCEYPPDPEEIEAKNIDLTGLSPKCAETIWCRFRLYKKQRNWNNSTHTALLWPDITRAKAEKLFDSPILNGTLFNEWEDSMWDDGWIHTFGGQWNFEQICYLLKRKEARSFIRAISPANHFGSRYSF